MRCLIAIIVALSLSACGGIEDSPNTSAFSAAKGDGVTMPAPVVIDLDDNNTTVQVAVDQAVTINLPSNPSTGYKWSCPSTRTLPLLDSGYMAGAPALVGSGGYDYFMYQPDSFLAGRQHSIECSYARDWEPAPIDTFVVTLSVQGSQPAADVVVTKNDAGQIVEAKVGDVVEVQLPGNITTGYSWKLPAVSRSLPLVDEFYTPDQPVQTGSGGTFSFVFAPDFYAAGHSFTLTFAYQRSWEEVPIDTFSFTLAVAHKCRPLCKMFCEHGFERDENGCQICKCAPPPQDCPPVVCELYCPNGLKKDDRGCEICVCE